jgi:hypothetical protein
MQPPGPADCIFRSSFCTFSQISTRQVHLTLSLSKMRGSGGKKRGGPSVSYRWFSCLSLWHRPEKRKCTTTAGPDKLNVPSWSMAKILQDLLGVNSVAPRAWHDSCSQERFGILGVNPKPPGCRCVEGWCPFTIRVHPNFDGHIYTLVGVPAPTRVWKRIIIDHLLTYIVDAFRF